MPYLLHHRKKTPEQHMQAFKQDVTNIKSGSQGKTWRRDFDQIVRICQNSLEVWLRIAPPLALLLLLREKLQLWERSIRMTNDWLLTLDDSWQRPFPHLASHRACRSPGTGSCSFEGFKQKHIASRTSKSSEIIFGCQKHQFSSSHSDFIQTSFRLHRASMNGGWPRAPNVLALGRPLDPSNQGPASWHPTIKMPQCMEICLRYVEMPHPKRNRTKQVQVQLFATATPLHCYIATFILHL